jgi:hypothetical protein
LPNPDYPGIYSKEAPFVITSSGFASFKTDAVNTPSGVGFVYSGPTSGPWIFENESMPICVRNFAQGKSIALSPQESTETEEVVVNIYPNPNNGQTATLEYDFLSDEAVSVEMFEVSGKQVCAMPHLKGGSNTTTLALNGLQSGMYLVHVFTASERKIVRLIIH